MTATAKKPFISVGQAAEQLDVTAGKLKRLVDAGQVTAYRHPAGLRFKRQELVNALDRCQDAPPSARREDPSHS